MKLDMAKSLNSECIRSYRIQNFSVPNPLYFLSFISMPFFSSEAIPNKITLYIPCTLPNALLQDLRVA